MHLSVAQKHQKSSLMLTCANHDQPLSLQHSPHGNAIEMKKVS